MMKGITVGRSENKAITKFSSYENNVKTGVVVMGVIYFYLQEVNPSVWDMVVKFFSTLIGSGKGYYLCE